jgi:hypothetical protein
MAWHPDHGLRRRRERGKRSAKTRQVARQRALHAGSASHALPWVRGTTPGTLGAWPRAKPPRVLLGPAAPGARGPPCYGPAPCAAPLQRPGTVRRLWGAGTSFAPHLPRQDQRRHASRCDGTMGGDWAAPPSADVGPRGLRHGATGSPGVALWRDPRPALSGTPSVGDAPAGVGLCLVVSVP